MNICYCKNPVSNCQNIDEDLYVCQFCGKHILPGKVYNSWKNRTSITIKSIIFIILDIFRKRL